MEQIDFNNYKPCFITRFGYKIDMIRAIYRRFGIKESIMMCFAMIRLNIHKFRYKHCSKYRNKINSGLDSVGLMILNMFLWNNNGTFDIKEILNNLSEEERAKWREQAIKSINEQIEKFNITDEEQIAKMYEMFGLDYNKFKPRPGFDD